MSKYTMELRHILQSLLMTAGIEFDPTNYNEVIVKAAPLFFNFYFPIYDEAYKETLEHKILKHYYMREIGSETFTLFKLRFDEKLNLGMPYFNKLYAIDWDLNPFNNVDIRTEHELKKSGDTTTEVTETTENSNTSTNTNIGETFDNSNNTVSTSDTPQNQLDDVYYSSYVSKLELNNAASGSNISSTSELSGSNEGTKEGSTVYKLNTTDSFLEHRYGYEGVNVIDQYEKLKNTIISVDSMILDYLEDLFISIW